MLVESLVRLAKNATLSPLGDLFVLSVSPESATENKNNENGYHTILIIEALDMV